MADDTTRGPHVSPPVGPTSVLLTSAASPPPLPDVAASTAWTWARLVVAAVSRAVAEIEGPPRVPGVSRSPADAVVGAAALAAQGVVRLGHVTVRVVTPVGRVLLAPPLVPHRWQPGAALQRLGDLGRRERVRGSIELDAILRRLVPRVADALLDQLDLTGIVIDRVDLDTVVARVDIESVVARLDIDSIVAAVDLDAIVDRIDVDSIVSSVDLDAIAARIDVDAVAARLDVGQVISRVDLIGLAEYVVEGIDLPEIIRDSTGSIASEAVRGVRMQSVEADELVSRFFDRLSLRRKPRNTAVDVQDGATIPSSQEQDPT